MPTYSGPLTLGDELAELESYDLGPESKVWIVGGYHGTTARILADLYDPTIWVFDPQDEALDHLYVLAGENPKVHVFPFGLGARTGNFRMREVGNDAASFYGEWNRPATAPPTRDPGDGLLIDIAPIVQLAEIDLLLLNCEGAEFEIIPRIASMHRLSHIRYVLMQMHLAAAPGTPPEDVERLCRIMEQTHRLRYDDLPTWAGWERRE